MKVAQQPEITQNKTTRNLTLWWLPAFIGVAIVVATLLYFKGIFRDVSQIPVDQQELIVHDLLEIYYRGLPYPPDKNKEYPIPITLWGFSEIQLPKEIRGRHLKLVKSDDYPMIRIWIRFDFRGQC